MLQDAVRFLRAHDDILLIAHVSPDGDTLGSCFALYGALLELGKHAQVVCENNDGFHTYSFGEWCDFSSGYDGDEIIRTMPTFPLPKEPATLTVPYRFDVVYRRR